MQTTSLRRDLAPAGPIDRLDRAFTWVRAGGLGPAARAWSAGIPLAGIAIGLYYVERVEGVFVLRAPFALAIALGWWIRALLLGRVARDLVRRFSEGIPIPPDAGRPIAVLRTSMWTALGLWMWSWLLVLGALGGPIGIALVAPLFALRGAIAPSWIARAACTSDAGFRVLREAFGDSDGQRASGAAAELLVVLGALGLYLNFWGALAVGLVLGRSLLGIELALVEQFLSWRNGFVVGVLAASVLVALEPIRAALSAIAFVEARVREEGLDLQLIVEDAIAHANRPRAQPKATLAALFAMAVGLGAGTARAQPRPPIPPPLPSGFIPEPPVAGKPDPAASDSAGTDDTPSRPAPAPPIVAPDPHDAVVRREAAEILARPEFREFEDHPGRGLRELIERLVEWLFRHRDPIERPLAPRPIPSFSLPGPLGFMVAAIAIAAALIGLAFFSRPWQRARPRLEVAAATSTSLADPRERASTEWVDDADRLAAEGRYREALRALYLATLVALDRRRIIRFDATLTNGQYVRQMPEGQTRRAFRELTRIFDRIWYGQEEAGEHVYRCFRALVDQIVSEPSVATPDAASVGGRASGGVG
jgi:hypothetical protein